MKQISNNSIPNPVETDHCLDYSGRDDLLSGGVKLIPVATPKETFHV